MPVRIQTLAVEHRKKPFSIEANATAWTVLTLINVEVGPKRPTVFVRLFQSLITFNNFFTQNKNSVQWCFQFFPTITVRPTILT
jgi:hypothetical protein